MLVMTAVREQSQSIRLGCHTETPEGLDNASMEKTRAAR